MHVYGSGVPRVDGMVSHARASDREFFLGVSGGGIPSKVPYSGSSLLSIPSYPLLIPINEEG